MYGYVVIDAGNSLNENAVTLMDSAFRVLHVVTPELASLHNAREFLEIGQSLNFPDDKVLMVLNRSDMKDGIKEKQIQDALPVKLFAKIPEDYRGAMQSINQGIPLFAKSPKSRVGKSITDIGNKLINLTKKEIRAAALASESS